MVRRGRGSQIRDHCHLRSDLTAPRNSPAYVAAIADAGLNQVVSLRRQLRCCPYFRRPRTRLLITSRTLVADTSRSNMPRSTSIVMSRSVTSIVPFMGVLTNPIFAVSENESVSPCQAFRSSANRTERISIPLNTSLNERSTDCLISSLGRSCEIVILTVGFPQSITRRHGHGFGIFRSELLVIRILLAQFVEQSLR
jgi:hypothetical protein